MADDSDTKLNLSVLQRLDNSITAIVDSASQVALYKFSSENNEWEKTEIEGTLFVYMRSKKPQHGFIVMNRVNTRNFVEQITNKLEFQIQIPFLLYRNRKGNIFGIWFYEQEHCRKIGRLLKGLSELNIPKQKLGDKAKETRGKENNNFNKMDIMSLLTRAQEEYDKRTSTQESSSTVEKNSLPPHHHHQQQHQTGIVRPTPVRANGVVMTNGSSPVALSVDTLFAQAGDGKHVYKAENMKLQDYTRTRSFSTSTTENSKPGQADAGEDILHKLLSNTAAGNVTPERKEKYNPKKITRARSATYGSNSATAGNGSTKQACMAKVEKDLKERLNISPKCVPMKQIASQVKSELPSHPELILGTPTAGKSEAMDIPILTPAMFELSSSVPSASTLQYQMHHKDVVDSNSFSASSLPTASLQCSSSPASASLLSPMDFKVPAKNSSPNLGESPPEIDESFAMNSSHCFDGIEKELLAPKNLIHGIRSEKQSSPIGVTPLTKYQLREALSYLLQNDEDFIDRLHDCYLKSLKSQLNGYRLS